MEVKITYKNKEISVSYELAETLCLRNVAKMEGEKMNITLTENYKGHRAGKTLYNVPFMIAKVLIEGKKAVAYNGIESARALKAEQQKRVEEVVANVEPMTEPATEPEVTLEQPKPKRATKTKKTK